MTPSLTDEGPSVREVFTGLYTERESERSREAGLVAEVADFTFEEWALLVPERDGPLNFTLFPFQSAYPESSAGKGEPGLYSDEVAAAREVVIEKATQVGVSSNLWRWAMRRADQFGDRVIYVFPTEGGMSAFSQERIEPSIDDSEYLSSRIPRDYVRNQGQKRVGAGWTFWRGSTQSRLNQRTTRAQSTAADALVFDEYDDLDQRSLAQYERRVSGAQAAGRQPRIRRVGVPSVDGYGISAAFARSDQRVWHVVCSGCGEEQQVEWETNMRWINEDGERVLSPGNDEPGEVERAWRVCRACELELDVRDGRWLAQNPGARIVGFRVARLIVPGTDLAEIVRNSRKHASFEVEAFYNNDLGRAYTPTEAGLTRGQVEAACGMGVEMRESYPGPLTVIGGLDVASERTMHIRISAIDGEQRVPLYIAEVEDFDEVERLMHAFNIRLLAVDSMPERRAARTLAGKFPGRVVLARYDERPEADPIIVDARKNLVHVQRTEAIDAMMDAVRSGRQVLPQNPPPRYVEHMIALKRRMVERASGQSRRVYVTVGSAGDDFAHAETFNVIAHDVLRLLVNVYEGTPQEEVATAERLGYDPVVLDTGYEGERDPFGE